MKLYIQQKLFLLLCNKNKNKPFKLNPETSGFTILEVIVTTAIGLLMISGGMGGFLMIQENVAGDRGRIDVNKRLSSVLSSMGPDIQQMGEGLVGNTKLPVLDISQRVILGSTINKTSDIKIQRTLLPLTLSVCAEVESGTSDPLTVMSETDPNDPPNPNPNPGCQPSQNDNDPKDGWPDNVKKWLEKRVNEGGTVSAYVFGENNDDPATLNGEFFNYTGEDTDIVPAPTGGNPVTDPKRPNIVELTTDSHTWENDYKINSSIYLIDERTYKVTNDGILQMETRTGETFDISEGIDRLEITAVLQKINDTTEYRCKRISATSTDCGIPDYGWSDVKYIEVKVVAIDPTDNKELVRNKPGQRSNLKPEHLTMTQRFLPRNRLSF